MSTAVPTERPSLSASPLSSSPVLLAPIRISEAFNFLHAPHGSARYRAAFGGRGSGKSHGFAEALIIKAASQPLRVLCAREIQNSIRDSVKRLLHDKIEAYGYGGFYDETDTEIRGANGSLFTFAGLRTNVDSVKSTEGLDIVWVEEASTVSKSSLEILVPTVRKPDSEIWFTWNPRLPTDPVDKMFRGGEKPPRSLVRRVNWNANEFFPAVLIEEMEHDKRRDPDKYAHIWLGDYQRNSEARVFRNWRVAEFETPPDARFHFGADWGFAIDPTVLVRCYIVGKTLFVDREAYKVGCQIEKTPDLFKTIPGSQDWQITADSARPETIDYVARHGFPKMKPALKGPSSVMDGIEFLKNYDIVVHPSCKHTADELALYSFKTDKLTGEILPVLEDKKNHVIDALRYAIEGLRRASGFKSVPLRL
jgi:phage terminase large subunit